MKKLNEILQYLMYLWEKAKKSFIKWKWLYIYFIMDLEFKDSVGNINLYLNLNFSLFYFIFTNTILCLIFLNSQCFDG